MHSLLDPTTPQIVVSNCLGEMILKIFFKEVSHTFAHPAPTDHKIEEGLSGHPEITRVKQSLHFTASELHNEILLDYYLGVPTLELQTPLLSERFW